MPLINHRPTAAGTALLADGAVLACHPAIQQIVFRRHPDVELVTCAVSIGKAVR